MKHLILRVSAENFSQQRHRRLKMKDAAATAHAFNYTIDDMVH